LNISLEGLSGQEAFEKIESKLDELDIDSSGKNVGELLDEIKKRKESLSGY